MTRSDDEPEGPVHLLDANVLVALVVADHVHHEPASTWLAELRGRIASCPMTQGALVRLLVREGTSGADAQRVLAEILADERHEAWPDHLSFGEVDLRAVIGHRQVTDAYLASLARARHGRLVTFDRGLAAVHADVVDLILA